MHSPKFARSWGYRIRSVFELSWMGKSRALNPLIRDQVYRIGREGLSNAFRHSGTAMVEMEISYGERDLRLAVHDTGCGIDEKVLQSGHDGHRGLIGMRESAEKIGART
jgi:signal transduction histidine kinase